MSNPSDFDLYNATTGANEPLLTHASKEDAETNDPVIEATMTSSVVNLTNSIVGSGILALPYAFASSGWVIGYVLLLLASLATVFSLHILSKCCVRVKPPATFYKVADASIPRFTFLVDFSVAIMCFGVGLSYLIVIGDLMPGVVESGFFSKRQIWVTLGFCIVGPLSCLKNLDALKFTSALAIVLVAFIAVLIFAYAVDPSSDPCADDSVDDCKGTTTLATFGMESVRRLGIFVFAFSCQMNIFPVVNELKNCTQRRVDRVVYCAIALALGLYCMVSGAGYHLYGDDVDSNILSSFPNSAVTSMARIFVSLLVCFSYPLLCSPGRKSALSLWAVTDKDPEASVLHENFRFTVITALFLFGTFGLALILTDLGLVLSLIGATGSTITTFILPGAAYYVMFKEEGPLWKRTCALVLLGFGLVFMPVCLVFLFI